MLDQLNTAITDLLGPAGPLIVVAGLAILLILAAIPILLSTKPDPLDKLKETSQKKMDAQSRAVLRDRRRNTPSPAASTGGRLAPSAWAGTSPTRRITASGTPESSARMPGPPAPSAGWLPSSRRPATRRSSAGDNTSSLSFSARPGGGSTSPSSPRTAADSGRSTGRRAFAVAV